MFYPTGDRQRGMDSEYLGKKPQKTKKDKHNSKSYKLIYILTVVKKDI